MKTKNLFTTLALLSVVLYAGCKKDDFTEVAGVCPVVVSTNPANNATGVPLIKIISVTFNEKMNPETITPSSFSVQAAGASVSAPPQAAMLGKVNFLSSTPIAGTITYSGNTASFTPSSALSPITTYSARITTAVKDEMGNAIQSDYVWTFSTDASPNVISTDPANLAAGVPLNKVIKVKFSEVMDQTTLTAVTYTIKQGANSVAGAVTYSDSTATFTPSSNLTPNTVYTGTITTSAKNLTGTPVSNNYVWTFTTGLVPTVLSTDPLANATAVPLNKVVAATFSAAMDPLTVTASNFTLKAGATSISGVVSYSGTTAKFTPNSNLLSGTLYTATLTTGIKNATGNQLANNYVWSFTTASVLTPTVVSTDPLNLATGVVLNKSVIANFSMSMDPTSINTSTFTLKDGANSVAGVVTYSGSSATFNPNSNLTASTLYTATVTTGAKNVSGASLANNYVWTFTTGAVAAPTVISTDPLKLATGVAVNKVVSATFSVPMDALTLTSSTFLLKAGTTSVSGVVNYSGSTATFTPNSNLLEGTTYTATITTGAKNPAGTGLGNNYVWTFTTTQPSGTPFVDLKSVGNFGIIAGVGVSNDAGFSEIHDLDVGIYPGVRSSITGFPPAIIVNGEMYAADDIAPPGVPAMLIQAKQDLVDAYLFAEGAVSPAPATVAGDQGGKTLAPGIYKSTSTLLIQFGDLTLDAGGNPNAFWIFQVASDFTTVGGAGGSVILSGGAQAKNVTWQIGSSATIGDGTSFKGNVLALQTITMKSGAVAQGRMLARNGSVTMTSSNIITKP